MTNVNQNRSIWKKSRSSILHVMQRHPGVTGVDYGYLYRDGVRDHRRGVRFHVQAKLPVEELAPTQVLPSTMSGLPCDVLQASYSMCASAQDSCDPLQLGVSVGNHSQRSTGTLGLVVRDKLSGREAILSNWHVLCGSTRARPGNALIQPGFMHMGTREPRLVARLERWLPLSTGLDAAVGLLDPGIRWRQELFGALVAVRGVAPPRLGARLAKYGAASNYTEGVVDGVNGSYVINYSSLGDVARSMDGFVVRRAEPSSWEEISLEGDSGALWIDRQGRAVGLLFAGEDGRGPTADYALAHSIERIFALLQVEPL